MTKNDLNNVDLSFCNEYLPAHLKIDFNSEAGKEHYRLLNFICKDKNLVFDVGTYRGSSAIAMTSAKQVISYNIEDQLEVLKPSNVTFKIGDALKDPDLLKADLILLDTFHNGAYEYQFYEFLKNNGYKGLLLLDDIMLNREMMGFWSSITHNKEDLTSLGHYSGTGIVYFNSQPIKRCNTCNK